MGDAHLAAPFATQPAAEIRPPDVVAWLEELRTKKVSYDPKTHGMRARRSGSRGSSASTA